MPKSSDTLFKNDYKMLSIRLLNSTLDSLKNINDSLSKKISNDLKGQLHYLNLPADLWKKAPILKKKDTTFLSILPDSARNMVYDNALGIVYNIKNSYQLSGIELDNKKNDVMFGLIEWHRKFSLSLACLILFFIGAPMGSIIRKGGLGMPLVVAILFFLIFHLLNMFGEKFVKEGILSPFTGMWLAILVLAPVGIFLTYKAMHDSQLFNKEFYHRFFKKIKPVLNKLKNAIIKKPTLTSPIV